MKKTKILTNIMIITLALGVGGCSGSKIKIVDPVSLIQRAAQAGNYTLTFTINEWLSDSIVLSNYNSGDYDEDSLWATMTLAGTYVYTIYYTTDAVLCNITIDYGDSVHSTESVVYINDSDNTLKSFVSYEGEDYSYYGSYFGTWQQHYFYLNDIVDAGYADESYFELIEDGKYDNEPYELYYVTDANALAYLTVCSGIDWVYDDYESIYTDFIFFGAYYFTELKEMYALYADVYWAYADSSNSTVCIAEDDLTAHFYDVGFTDISKIVKSCLALL